MITSLSRYLSSHLAAITNLEDKVDYLRYGIELIVGYLIKISILFIIAYYFNIVVPTLIIVVAFVSMRIMTGGTHLKTYSACFTFSLTCFLMLSSSTNFLIQIHLPPFLFLAFFNIFILIGLLICIKYVPVKRVKTEESKKIRNRAIVLLLIWSLFIHLGYFNGVGTDLLAAAFFGLFLQLSSITPLGILGMNKLNQHLFERGER